MARKKSAPKKKTVKKSKSKALVSMKDYEKQMEATAQTDSQRTGKAGESMYMSTKDGIFTFKDSDLGDSMQVVILNFAAANMYYDSKWDPDDPNSPACCAIGMEDNDLLVPFDESPEPQSDSCEECENNEWGSADVGKGKRCSNRKMLAILPTDDILAEDDEFDIAILSVAPTSMGNFNKYIKGIAKKVKRPCYGVITEIYFDDDDSKVLRFKLIEAIEDAADMAAIMDKRELTEDMLCTEPDFSNYHVVEKRAKRKPKAKKKSSGKKSSPKRKSRRSNLS